MASVTATPSNAEIPFTTVTHHHTIPKQKHGWAKMWSKLSLTPRTCVMTPDTASKRYISSHGSDVRTFKKLHMQGGISCVRSEYFDQVSRSIKQRFKSTGRGGENKKSTKALGEGKKKNSQQPSDGKFARPQTYERKAPQGLNFTSGMLLDERQRSQTHSA